MFMYSHRHKDRCGQVLLTSVVCESVTAFLEYILFPKHDSQGYTAYLHFFPTDVINVLITAKQLRISNVIFYKYVIPI